MSYTAKVVNYFNNEDTREQEDLARQIEEGSYQDELSSLTETEIKDLVVNLLNNYDLTKKQYLALKKVNHIGAYIVLAGLE